MLVNPIFNVIGLVDVYNYPYSLYILLNMAFNTYILSVCSSCKLDRYKVVDERRVARKFYTSHGSIAALAAFTASTTSTKRRDLIYRAQDTMPPILPERLVTQFWS